jgi:superfamily II DNA or RNA helicase
VAISGKSKRSERVAALTGLRDGSLQVVCNAQLWVAGVDVPQIECIILLRPTKSLTFYLQSIGRGLRTSPDSGKQHLTVLDHAGSIFEHGPPDPSGSVLLVSVLMFQRRFVLNAGIDTRLRIVAARLRLMANWVRLIQDRPLHWRDCKSKKHRSQNEQSRVVPKRWSN